MGRQRKDDEARATPSPPVMVEDKVLATRPGRAAVTAGLKAGLVVGLVAGALQLLQLAEPLLTLQLCCCVPLPAVLCGVLAALWLPVPRQVEGPNALLVPSEPLTDTASGAVAGAVAGALAGTMQFIAYLALGLGVSPILGFGWEVTMASLLLGTIVPVILSSALGAAAGVATAAIKKPRTSLSRRPAQKPKPPEGQGPPTARRPGTAVGGGLATVIGGGVAALFGLAVIRITDSFLSGMWDFVAAGGHDGGGNWRTAAAAWAGSIVGLLATDVLLLWRCSRKQGDLVRRGLISKANCPIMLSGSMGMTLVFALHAAVSLWPYAGSLANLTAEVFTSGAVGLGAIGAAIGLFGGLLGVLVGVGFGAVVGVITHTDVGGLGQQETRLLSAVDKVLSVISIALFFAVAYLWISNPWNILPCIGWGFLVVAMALLPRGLGWWFAHSESNGDQ